MLLLLIDIKTKSVRAQGALLQETSKTSKGVIPAKAGIHLAVLQGQIGFPLDQPAAVENLFAGMTNKKTVSRGSLQ